jgi:hypothetical protein
VSSSPPREEKKSTKVEAIPKIGMAHISLSYPKDVKNVELKIPRRINFFEEPQWDEAPAPMAPAI